MFSLQMVLFKLIYEKSVGDYYCSFTHKGSGIAQLVRTSNAEAHADMITIPNRLQLFAIKL